MKKTALISTVTVLAIALCFGVAYAQQTPSGSSPQGGPPPPQQGGWYCPYAGGMMGSYGHGGWFCPWCGQSMGGGYGMMGPGMMGPMHGRVWGGGPQTSKPQPLSKNQAKLLLENYLRNTGNPNLKLGPITDKEGYYEAEIQTKDGSLVDKIQVDKYTGWFRSGYAS